MMTALVDRARLSELLIPGSRPIAHKNGEIVRFGAVQDCTPAPAGAGNILF
jgi:hypothetical protein